MGLALVSITTTRASFLIISLKVRFKYVNICLIANLDFLIFFNVFISSSLFSKFCELSITFSFSLMAWFNRHGRMVPTMDPTLVGINNLRVLQREDPDVEEILVTANQVTMYRFTVDNVNSDFSQWSRLGCKGCLFLIKRRIYPRYRMIVLNKIGGDFIQDIPGLYFEFEVEGRFVSFRNASQQIYSLWFHRPEDVVPVSLALNDIINVYLPVQAPTQEPMQEREEIWEASVTVENTFAVLEDCALTWQELEEEAYSMDAPADEVEEPRTVWGNKFSVYDNFLRV